jgi:hypothetical protein
MKTKPLAHKNPMDASRPRKKKIVKEEEKAALHAKQSEEQLVSLKPIYRQLNSDEIAILCERIDTYCINKLTRRVLNCFRGNEINYIFELVQKTESEISRIWGIGILSRRNIIEVLKSYNFELGMRFDQRTMDYLRHQTYQEVLAVKGLGPTPEEIETLRRMAKPETANIILTPVLAIETGLQLKDLQEMISLALLIRSMRLSGKISLAKDEILHLLENGGQVKLHAVLDVLNALGEGKGKPTE